MPLSGWTATEPPLGFKFLQSERVGQHSSCEISVSQNVVQWEGQPQTTSEFSGVGPGLLTHRPGDSDLH